ncbi:MAG: DUF58 domain-containing protein [Betaproteobacteria bacterium]
MIEAGLPRHVPRGVRPALEELLALRRHGAAMRRLLALETERREGARPGSLRNHGMDYAESRPYTAGDDVRRIDWRVTARTGRAHTKIFRPERGGDVVCIVDQRAPMRFGTRAAFKSVVAAHVAALAGWAAAAGGERFGAHIAGARARHVPLGAPEGAAFTLCAALAAGEPGTDEPLERLAARAAAEAPIGARFVFVSDLADPGESFERAAQALRERGELVFICVRDPLELQLPPPARYPLTDGREQMLLDTASAGVRAAHAGALEAQREQLRRLASHPGTRCLALSAGEDLFGMRAAA